jgi:hypothetical protein
MVRLRRPSVCFCPAEDIPPSAGHTLGVTPSGSRRRQSRPPGHTLRVASADIRAASAPSRPSQRVIRSRVHSGTSIMGIWPAPSAISNVHSGFALLNCLDAARGTNRSASPWSNRVGWQTPRSF